MVRAGFSEKVTYEQRLAGGEGAMQGRGIPGRDSGPCKSPATCLRSNEQVRGTVGDKRKSRREAATLPAMGRRGD